MAEARPADLHGAEAGSVFEARNRVQSERLDGIVCQQAAGGCQGVLPVDQRPGQEGNEYAQYISDQSGHAWAEADG
jgi:hypothetical protein